MKARYIIFTIAFGLAFVSVVPCQNSAVESSESEPAFPDSIVTFRYESIYLKSITLSSYKVRTVIDSVFMFIEDTLRYGETYLALKSDSGYSCYRSYNWRYFSEITLERKQVNNAGREELIVRWQQGTGISTWTHGWHEHTAGIEIWDLDEMTVIFSIQNYESHVSWTQEFAEDSTGMKPFSEREVISGESDFWCSNFDVQIESNHITVTSNPECPDQSDNTNLVMRQNETYIYIRKDDHYVLIKK